MPNINQTPTRLVAVVAALALIAAACGGTDRSSEDATSATTSATVEVAEEGLGPEETTTTEVVIEADSVTNTLEIGGPVEPGRYATDLVGTPIEFDLDENWTPIAGDPGGFILKYSENLSQFSESILVTRMASFGSAEDIDNPEPAGPSLAGPANDFDAWLEASGELLIDSDEMLTIDGLDVRQVQVRVDQAGTRTFPGGCGPSPDDRCFFVGGTLSDTLFFYIVRTTEVYRMWLVPQEGFDEPILLTAIALEGNEAFLDEAGELVATMTFGEPEPHPVALPDGPLWEAGLPAVVPAGEQMVPALGGLRFEMSEERFVLQDQEFLSFQSTTATDSPVPPGMIVAAVFTKPNGDTVSGVQGFLDTLGEIGTVTLSGDAFQTLGQDLVGYDFVGDFGSTGPTMTFSSATPGGSSNFAWTPGDFARLYIGALDDDGVIVVGYDGVTESDLRLGEAVFDEKPVVGWCLPISHNGRRCGLASAAAAFPVLLDPTTPSTGCCRINDVT